MSGNQIVNICDNHESQPRKTEYLCSTVREEGAAHISHEGERAKNKMRWRRRRKKSERREQILEREQWGDSRKHVAKRDTVHGERFQGCGIPSVLGMGELTKPRRDSRLKGRRSNSRSIALLKKTVSGSLSLTLLLSRSSGAATPDTLSPSTNRGPDAFPLLTLLPSRKGGVGFNAAD